MSKQRSKYVERAMYTGTSLDKFMDEARAFMAEYKLKSSDVDVGLNYDNCYYESDTPDIALRAFVKVE